MEVESRHPHQDSVDDFLKVPKDFRKHQAKTNNDGSVFSAFDPKQVEKATQLAGEFMIIANDHPNDPINKVVLFAKETAKTTDPELVRYSLMSFITHYPAARNGNLRIPPLIKRSAHSTRPNKKKVQLAPGPMLSRDIKRFDEGDNEEFMDWYREDPNYNEHHEHWHIVYSNAGVPDDKNPKKRIIMDRHGELFIYMHRQMLARYDTERAAMNMPLVEPFPDDYRTPIPQEYKPDKELENRDSASYAPREANSTIDDDTVNDLEKSRKAIEEAIEQGQFYDGTEIDIDLLGHVVEPSRYDRGDWDEFVDYYGGGLHGIGHGAIGGLNSNPDGPSGVMGDTRTSARDPIFYRWHRHIDNLINKWEENQEPNDFSNSPPVNIRDGDIILAFKDKLPQDSDVDDFGEKTFGGENFDADVSNNEYVTNALETKIKTREVTLIEDSDATEEIEYLYPREFYYFFRVENTSSSQFDATFRVFLVSEELADSRRHWIEMDKFKQTLSPGSKTVVSRDCDLSSIVRQPPQKAPEHMDDTALARGKNDLGLCDCGLPFHLLLPRGRKGGMNFKLLVFITDWSEDEVPRVSRCGSISYCGGASPYEKYPDGKPMGYPFDRPFKNNSYKETFDGLNNATIRDVTISWVDDFPEIET